MARKRNLDESWKLSPEELESALRDLIEESGLDLTKEKDRKSYLAKLHYEAPKIAKACAFNDYMLGDSLNSISIKYGIPYASLYTWAIKGKRAWKHHKAAAEQKFVDTLIEQKVEEVGMTMSLMLSLIRSSLIKLANKAEDIPINDIPKLSKALSDLHRFSRLKQGQPTDITETISKKSAKELVDEINLVDDEFYSSTLPKEEKLN